MINEANTGFMLLAASLVMLMTPGLAFFYGGLVGRSNTLTIMIQSFASLGITTVMWWLVGYSLCFSGGADGIYGNFDVAFLRNVTSVVDVNALAHPAGGADRLPDDVRDHHACTDHRCVHEPRHVQGVLVFLVVLAAVRLLPVRAHDLGQRPARAVGRPRLRRWHRGARLGRLGGAGIRAVRGQAQVRRLPAQHPVHRARHRPALVRVVRVQCGQRAEGRRHHRDGVPEHRPRSLVRGHHLAVHRVEAGAASRTSSAC